MLERRTEIQKEFQSIEKRQRHFERSGYSRQEIQSRREGGENIIQVLIERGMDNQTQIKWEQNYGILFSSRTL